jgi:hypothetical protein
MSDRVPLWQHLTDVVMREAPVAGLGFYSASRVVATEYNPGLGNAHSAFFEIFVGGGLVSAALYLVLWGLLLWSAVRILPIATGDPAGVSTLGLVALTFLMGITTSAPVQAGPLGFAFWSLTAILPALERQGAWARMHRSSAVPASRVRVVPQTAGVPSRRAQAR